MQTGEKCTWGEIQTREKCSYYQSRKEPLLADRGEMQTGEKMQAGEKYRQGRNAAGELYRQGRNEDRGEIQLGRDADRREMQPLPKQTGATIIRQRRNAILRNQTFVISNQKVPGYICHVIYLDHKV